MNDLKIVTLCGSTKFNFLFMEFNARFTLLDYIVLSCGMFGGTGISLSYEEKRKLDILHKRKISMSTEIYVIDPFRYIGESTKSEIEYAIDNKVKANYLSHSIMSMDKIMHPNFYRHCVVDFDGREWISFIARMSEVMNLNVRHG